ncbi:RNA-directed DNA polymerase, eukaryota, reverse transcriptase zinc-binding domain protein [Tanacetum coccineum]
MGDIAVLKLPEEEANDMIKNVSDKEIKDALFDIDSNKAAGPDWYTSCFFKKAWDIIGTDTPNKVSDFRHIAYCNVLYKCISKILTNKIKGGLSKVVSLNQSAFIPGRHIQDNILITQELLKGYNRKNGPKRCAMKIDIQKAYDTINWDFLKEVLLMVGGRGLRQGDPISPYLFTLVMEVFNMIMIKNIREDVKKSLDEFNSISGLFPNLSKSTIFFGSVNEKVKEDMLKILPFKCGKLLMRYLDVPLLAKRLGVKYCQNLLDYVESRINCWRNKLLSYTRRIQLIAFILSTMHQYWASVYILPLTVMNKLEKTFQKFLWKPRGSVKGKARVAWKFVCRPKEQGAMEDGNGLMNEVIGTLLLINLQSLLYPWKKDKAQWLCEGNKVMDYNTKAAWLTMRDNLPKVDWCKVVWYSQCSPKQAVILWMAIQRKLMTQDRMVWMQGDTLKCSLCNGCADSHDHLFFDCIFSKKVWGKLMAKGKIGLYSHSLNNIVMHLAANPHKSKIWQIVNKLILSSAVYHIWMERNKRNFQNLKRSNDALYDVIIRNIADILKCLKVKKSTEVLNVAKQWDLKWDEGKLIAEIGDQRS